MRALALAALCALACGAPAAGVVEGFESGLGGFAANGLWRWAAPGEACTQAHSGAAAVRFGRGGACDYNDGVVKDQSLWSPSFYVDTSAPYATFWTLWEVESDDPHCYDLMMVYAVDAGTGASTLLKMLNPQQPDNSGGGIGIASVTGMNGTPQWQYQCLDLSAFSGHTLQLRFRFADGGASPDSQCAGWEADAENDEFLGWYLDDVCLGCAQTSAVLTQAVGATISRNFVNEPLPAYGAAGETVEFYLYCVNQTFTAQSLQLWDTLPAGLTYASATPAPDTVSGQQVAWTLAAVPAGACVAVTLRAQVSAGFAGAYAQEVLNRASVAALGEAYEGNVGCLRIEPKRLELAKSSDTQSADQGQTVAYTLVLDNRSSGTTYKPRVDDSVPAGLEPVGSASNQWDAVGRVMYFPSLPTFDGSHHVVTRSTPSMKAGEVRVFGFEVAATADAGMVCNQAFAAGGTSSLLDLAHPDLTDMDSDCMRQLPAYPERPQMGVKAVYPNPAPQEGWPRACHVVFELQRPAKVTLSLYNVAGERVREIVQDFYVVAGQTKVCQMDWDLANRMGRGVTGGLYLIRLYAEYDNGKSSAGFGKVAVVP